MKILIRLSALIVLVLSSLLFCARGAHAQTATLVLCPNGGEVGNNAACVQPPTLVFGKQGVGTTSTALIVSVNNCAPVAVNGVNQIAACTGSGSLTLATSNYAVVSGNSDFVISGGTCSNSAVVASGSSCTILLTFSPTSATGEDVRVLVDCSDSR
jgi:hypothetical protein